MRVVGAVVYGRLHEWHLVKEKAASGILPLRVLDKRLEARFYHRLSRLT